MNHNINLNFINFSRPNLIINSNFAAHRWHCKHQKYLDTLYVLKLCLTGTFIYSQLFCIVYRCLSPTIAHLLSQKQILHCCNFLPRHSSNLFIDINMGFILFLHILTVVPNGITSKNCILSHLAEELSCALCTHRVQRRRRCYSRWGCNNVVESTTTSTNL